MAMFKGFKPQGLQKIASRMGYAGRMEEFDQYLEQNPDKQREMITYQAKAQQMAQGGMPTYVNPIKPKKDPNNLMGPAGAAVMSYGYNPTTNQYSISGGGGQQFGEGFESSMDMNELYKKYPQIKGTFEKGVPKSIPGGEYDKRNSFDGAPVGRGEPILRGDPRFEMPNFEQMPQQPNPATQARSRDRGFGQDVGSMTLEPIASQNQRLAPWMEGYDFFGDPNKSFEERNADLDKREREYKEANPNWRQILKDRYSESDTPLPIIPPQQPQTLADDNREQYMDYFKLPDGGRFAYDRRTRMAIPPGAVGVSKDEYMQIPEKPADYTSLSSVGQPINTSQPIGTTMATDTNIEDFSVQQALNPTLPQGGATVAAGTPITQDQMVDPATGQLRPQAPTVGTAALGTTTTSTAPTATPATQMDASLSSLNVTQALQPIQSAQGSVSQQAQMTAQQQSDSKVSDLQAAQGTATLMQNPVQREIQSGELISGGVANAEKASTYAEQIEAATATPSEQATVQGQLANLTADFDATNPPAWAAGALRGIQAQMAARGLGASSMAAQAMVQGALESALPIAQADAQTRASFEQANLSNRQQRAMLAAQQRAAFIGQEFDQEFQTRVQNAAKISDIANMNFTAEQQIALENSRAANTMGLANLSNRQAMVMAEASALANLDMSNLNNRQQAAVQNAQAFMQMDMANLNNSQQTGMFKAQSLVQSLFNDQSATNASRQFNASSQNQTDQFFANLATTVANFNAEQANAMSRYNSGELNALEQFNANMKNQREQFNAQNRLVIDQSNAQWRRQVATADTAAINRANELNARALIDLSTGAYNNLWQGFRDDMEFAWKTADNAEERSKDILLRKMQDESTVAAAALAADQDNAAALASGIVNLATTNTGSTVIGSVIDGVTDAASWLWDKLPF